MDDEGHADATASPPRGGRKETGVRRQALYRDACFPISECLKRMLPTNLAEPVLHFGRNGIHAPTKL